MEKTPEIPKLVIGMDGGRLPIESVASAASPAYRATVESAAQVPGLLRNGDPNTAVKESPSGRAMCYAAMAGKTNKQIAADFSVSVITVSNTLRQPWAKQFMTEELRRLSTQDGGILSHLREEGLNSVRMLIEIRDDPKTAPKTRADICNSIIDRVIGKAIQRVETDQKITHQDAAEEAAKIDAELKALREQVNGRAGQS